MVVAETRDAARCSSPWMRWQPQRGFSPAWVLPSQANDQLLHLLIYRWSAGLVVRVGPGAGDQVSVPTQQRLRCDEEAGPAGSEQDAADRGQ
jgi:hypothetical protein